MVKFQPSFSFWPRPQFLGESRSGLATWIVDRHAALANKHDDVRETAVQRIIDNHHNRNGQTIEPSKAADADV